MTLEKQQKRAIKTTDKGRYLEVTREDDFKVFMDKTNDELSQKGLYPQGETKSE